MFHILFHYSEFQEQEEENDEFVNQTAEYRSTIFEMRATSNDQSTTSNNHKPEIFVLSDRKWMEY